MTTNNSINQPGYSTTDGIIYFDGTKLVSSSTAKVNTSGSAGSINNSAQPFLNAYMSSSTGGVTGDNTLYAVIYDTVIKSQGLTYSNASGVITALVAGNYIIFGQIALSSIVMANTLAILSIQQSGSVSRTYQCSSQNPYSTRDGNNNLCMGFYAPFTLAASDQIITGVTVNGNSSKNINLLGNGNPLTYICAVMLS